MEQGEEVVNAMNNIVSADAVTSIGTSIAGNISTLAPAILGVMGIVIAVNVVFRLIKKYSK